MIWPRTTPPIIAGVGLGNGATVILDRLESKAETRFVSTLHLAPGVDVEQRSRCKYRLDLGGRHLYLTVLGSAAGDDLCYLGPESSAAWYAPEMGLRIARGSLQLRGSIDSRPRMICTVFSVAPLELTFVPRGNTATLRKASTPLAAWHYDSAGLVLAAAGGPE